MTLNISLARQTVGGYVAQVEDELALVLKESTATLVEPRRVRPDARKMIAGFVELIRGFALGTIAGGVLHGTRTWFGGDVADELARRFHPNVAGDFPRLSVPYVADADRRPLVNHFGAQLHVRFGMMGRDVASLLATLDELVVQMAPAKRNVIKVVLNLLSKEDAIKTRVAAEISFAWATFVATMAGKPLPSTDGRSERSMAIWSAWRQCAHAVAPSDRDESQRAGYILRVA